MNPYTLTLFVHLASTVVLFMAFGIEWTAISFLASAKSPEEAQNWLRLGRLAPLVNGPALLVVILSGGYLASILGVFKLGMLENGGWVTASFIGIAVVALLGGAINIPKMRAIKRAIAGAGDALSPALQTKALPVSVRLRTFATLAIVFVMATKLPFGRSMLALGAGLLLGLFISIPILSRKSA